MNGELAQCVAFATHATMRLRGRPASLDAHSVLRHVATVTFDGVAGVDAWLRRLAGEDTDRVWLAAGGTRNGLLATGPAGNRLWQASWHVGDRNAPEQRIWLVDYRSQPVRFGPPRPGVQQSARELDGALRRAEEFAGRYELDPWRGVFAAARRTAGDGGDFPDLFPESWPDAAGRRLAAMAQAAWVFGGMGSWNDLGFAEDDLQREYDEISAELFGAVMTALVAAANADLALRAVGRGEPGPPGATLPSA